MDDTFMDENFNDPVPEEEHVLLSSDSPNPKRHRTITTAHQDSGLLDASSLIRDTSLARGDDEPTKQSVNREKVGFEDISTPNLQPTVAESCSVAEGLILNPRPSLAAAKFRESNSFGGDSVSPPPDGELAAAHGFDEIMPTSESFLPEVDPTVLIEESWPTDFLGISMDDGDRNVDGTTAMEGAAQQKQQPAATAGSQQSAERQESVVIPFSRMRSFLAAAYPGRRMQRAAVKMIADLAVRLTEALVLEIFQEKLWTLGDPRQVQGVVLKLTLADVNFLDRHQKTYPWSVTAGCRQWLTAVSALKFATNVPEDLDDDDDDRPVPGVKRRRYETLPSNQQAITAFFRPVAPGMEWRQLQPLGPPNPTLEASEDLGSALEPNLINESVEFGGAHTSSHERSEVPSEDNDEDDWLTAAIQSRHQPLPPKIN